MKRTAAEMMSGQIETSVEIRDSPYQLEPELLVCQRNGNFRHGVIAYLPRGYGPEDVDKAKQSALDLLDEYWKKIESDPR